ncbi:MAG: uracil-DNA glycosylase [Beijerinckiaceae bacterium]
MAKNRPGMEAIPGEPPADCSACPRLHGFLEEHRIREPDWHNAPVRSFGVPDGTLLVVGLAPGLRGANRTGRPFTGDYAGDLLYATLKEYGFASGTYEARPDDSLTLKNCAITNAVRCVPPQNKPLPAEIRTCQPFLANTIRQMPRLRALVVLGRIAHESVLRTLGQRLALFPFKHAAQHDVAFETRPLRIFDSYHCSRYNTNTGVLTPDMFRNVFASVRDYCG